MGVFQFRVASFLLPSSASDPRGEQTPNGDGLLGAAGCYKAIGACILCKV